MSGELTKETVGGQEQKKPSYAELMNAAYEREIYTKESNAVDLYYDFCDKLSAAVVNLGSGSNFAANPAVANNFVGTKGVGNVYADGKKLSFNSAASLDASIKRAFGHKNADYTDDKNGWKEGLRKYRRPLVAEKPKYASYKNILKEADLSKRSSLEAQLSADKKSSYNAVKAKFDVDVDQAHAKKIDGVCISNAESKKAVNASSAGTITDDYNNTGTVSFVEGSKLNLKLGREEQNSINAEHMKFNRNLVAKDLQSIIAEYSPSNSLVLQSFMHWGHAGCAHVKGGSGYYGVNKLFKDGSNIELFTQQVKQGYWDDNGIALLEKTADPHVYKYVYPKEDYEANNNGLVNNTLEKSVGSTWAEKIHNQRIGMKKSGGSNSATTTQKPAQNATSGGNAANTGAANSVGYPVPLPSPAKHEITASSLRIRTAPVVKDSTDTKRSYKAGDVVTVVGFQMMGSDMWLYLDSKEWICGLKDGKSYTKQKVASSPSKSNKTTAPAAPSSKTSSPSISERISGAYNDAVNYVSEKAGAAWDYVTGWFSSDSDEKAKSSIPSNASVIPAPKVGNETKKKEENKVDDKDAWKKDLVQQQKMDENELYPDNDELEYGRQNIKSISDKWNGNHLVVTGSEIKKENGKQGMNGNAVKTMKGLLNRALRNSGLGYTRADGQDVAPVGQLPINDKWDLSTVLHLSYYIIMMDKPHTDYIKQYTVSCKEDVWKDLKGNSGLKNAQKLKGVNGYNLYSFPTAAGCVHGVENTIKAYKVMNRHYQKNHSDNITLSSCFRTVSSHGMLNNNCTGQLELFSERVVGLKDSEALVPTFEKNEAKANHMNGKAIDVSNGLSWVKANGSHYGFKGITTENWHFNYHYSDADKEIQKEISNEPLDGDAKLENGKILSPAQVKNALDWYKSDKVKKYYTSDVIRQIQKIVGVPETGELSDGDIEKIAKWQKIKGACVDGEFGNGSCKLAGIKNIISK